MKVYPCIGGAPGVGGTITAADNGLYIDGTTVKLGTNALVENTNIALGGFDWTTSGSGLINFSNVLPNTFTASIENHGNLLGFGIQGAALQNNVGGGATSVIGAFDISAMGLNNNASGIVSLSTGVRDANFLVGENSKET